MSQPPYDQLFIYEILGDARGAVDPAAPGYLGLWLEETTSFVFFARPAEAAVAALLARDAGLGLRERHHLTYAEWQGGLELEPFAVAQVWVVPAWREAPPEAAGRPLLSLDPGLVFGSGLHPTTRHCLELLARSAARRPLARVVDLGCGTGLLGLFALVLGAGETLAVDLNPLCVTTTRQNAGRNRLPLRVAEGPAGDFLDRPAELWLANLPWEVQRTLWRPGAWQETARELILSGVTRSQVGPLEDLLKPLGFRARERKEAESTWFSLWLERN